MRVCVCVYFMSKVEGQSQKGFYLHEVPGIVKFTETGSRMVVAGGGAGD